LIPEELTPEHILRAHLQSALFPSDTVSGNGMSWLEHVNLAICWFLFIDLDAYRWKYFLSVEDCLHIDEMTDFEQLTSVLHDILLTAVICKVELVTLLLHGLLDRLKSLAAKLTVLVPEDLYLPAPPIYCPQPAQTIQVILLVRLERWNCSFNISATSFTYSCIKAEFVKPCTSLISSSDSMW